MLTICKIYASYQIQQNLYFAQNSAKLIKIALFASNALKALKLMQANFIVVQKEQIFLQ